MAKSVWLVYLITFDTIRDPLLMKFRINLFLLVAFLQLAPKIVIAEEGMWLPLLLENQKFAEMRELGLNLSPEEIYSINQACIKDAVVGLMGEGSHLRSFATASFISENGLLLTNYHVVLSFIERFSTPENDFLKYGYWAKNSTEESLCRGLRVKQLIKMEDVTEMILEGTKDLKGREKQDLINKNGQEIAAKATKGTNHEANIQAMFGESQYIMSIYKVYKDVRMVAAPPFSLGKYGGNADNYSWPRHTLDFAILRVYANNDNQPANHSPQNVPYKPKHYLPISAEGADVDDFVMVVGFPGSTRQYIPSFALERIINGETAQKVAIAREKMIILNNSIEENPETKYRYTNRLSVVGNNYLRWKGEIMGVNRMNLVDQKREQEKAFNHWVHSDANRSRKYAGILEEMEELYKEVAIYNMANTLFLEAGINGSEIVPFIGKFEKLVAMYNRKRFNQSAANREASNLIKLSEQFFNNWNYEVDRRIFRNLTYRYYQNIDPRFVPEELESSLRKNEGDIELLSQEVFKSSIFTSKDNLIAFLENNERDVDSKIKNDELYQIAIGFYKVNVDKITRQRSSLQSRLISLQSIYIEGILEMNGENHIFPDANNSQRISYGTIIGTNAEDGLFFHPFTNTDGMYVKYLNNPDNEEFYIPRRLLHLFASKDFGRYANQDGRLAVNFLTNSHTTSGSSGSPVINARGHLVGLNFDRIWQGVASDYIYSSETSRSIAVDARFIMFVLEKYSPTTYVFDEISGLQ